MKSENENHSYVRYGKPYLCFLRKRAILRASSVKRYAGTRNHCYFSYPDCRISHCNQVSVVYDFAPFAYSCCCFCSLLFASEMTMTTQTIKVKYYHDAGHGWVAVKRNLLRESGLEKEISAFSYQKGQTVYLEEDSDAYKFVKAMEAKGYAFDVEHRHTERSPIRSYASYFTV